MIYGHLKETLKSAILDSSLSSSQKGEDVK